MTEELRQMIAETLEQAKASLESIADEAGVSYATLYAWANGRRNPSPENLAKLADALERRGGELNELAAKLREAADD